MLLESVKKEKSNNKVQNAFVTRLFVLFFPHAVTVVANLDNLTHQQRHETATSADFVKAKVSQRAVQQI